MKGTLKLEKVQHDGKVVIRVLVVGNVGDEGRAVLDELGLVPVVNLANARDCYVTTPAALDTLRTQLVSRGIVYGPSGN